MSTLKTLYILFLASIMVIGLGTILGGDAQAHDPQECVCPEPPPPPVLVCADGSTPRPMIVLESAEILMGDPAEAAEAEAEHVPDVVQKALDAIEAAENYDKK